MAKCSINTLIGNILNNVHAASSKAFDQSKNSNLLAIVSLELRLKIPSKIQDGGLRLLRFHSKTASHLRK